MSRQIKILQAELRKQNEEWGILFSPIPKETWPPIFTQMNPAPTAVCRNHNYLVQIFPEFVDVQRISICRTMIANDGRWEDGMTWDDLMKIKNQIGYGDRWAVEVYPPDGNVVNVANMRHLWILPERLAVGWRAI